MQLLPVADVPARPVPTQEDHEGRVQWDSSQGEVQGLWQDAQGELTEAGLKIHQEKAAKQAAASWSSQSSQDKINQDNKDFQEFLMWRRAHRPQDDNLQNQSAGSSRREDIFM